MTKKELSESASVIGVKGGKATLKKHGKEHYKKMAEKRWANQPATK